VSYYVARRRRAAAFDPSFPSAVRVRFDRCVIVRLRRAAAAAFLMLARATVFRFLVAMAYPSRAPIAATQGPAPSLAVLSRPQVAGAAMSQFDCWRMLAYKDSDRVLTEAD
jgi:hypothetical protein